MATQPITLNFDDPTVFAVCGGPCGSHYPGKKVGTYFGKAYTARKWRGNPKCDNCGSPMRFIREVAVEEVERPKRPVRRQT